MPLSVDVVTQIVNVHWGGGGVFIAGDIDGNIYYLNIESEGRPAWQELGQLDFHKEDEDGFVTGRVAGSAYAMVDGKSVFVLVGGHGFANELGIIMASTDGLNWSTVFSFGGADEDDTFIGAGIFGVVWDADAQMFYAGGYQNDSFVDADAGMTWVNRADILFVSSDGFSWQEADRHEIRVESALGDSPEWPEYKTGLLVAHCSPLVVDGNGNAIPDGNYGYDKSAEVLVAPAIVIKIDYALGFYLNEFPEGSSVVVTSQGGAAPPAYPPGVGIQVTCTATVGGRWLAAGGVHAQFDAGEGRCQAVILTASEGGGYFWDTLDPPGGTNAITTMTAGTVGTNAGL